MPQRSSEHHRTLVTQTVASQLEYAHTATTAARCTASQHAAQGLKAKGGETRAGELQADDGLRMG